MYIYKDFIGLGYEMALITSLPVLSLNLYLLTIQFNTKKEAFIGLAHIILILQFYIFSREK